MKSTVVEIATEWRKIDPNGIANLSCQIPAKERATKKFTNPWRF